MQEQDFLIKKYEYDNIYKLELERRLKEENIRFQEAKLRFVKKNNDFEKIRNDFIEKNNTANTLTENNLKFLQKRAIEKLNDVEKNKKIVKDFELKTNALMSKLTKSKKSLEIIYKKIEDIKLNQKIKKENIETNENIETFIINKRIKDNLNKNNINNINKDSNDKIQEIIDITDESYLTYVIKQNNFADNCGTTVNSFYLEKNNNSNALNNNFTQEKKNQEHFSSFEKFKERIDSLSVQNFDNVNSISLNYTSQSGGMYNISLLENSNLVNVDITIGSYRDYLNFYKEKTKILNMLRDKGLNIKDIILRQNI